MSPSALTPPRALAPESVADSLKKFDAVDFSIGSFGNVSSPLAKLDAVDGETGRDNE